jgi:hypothetical protein
MKPTLDDHALLEPSKDRIPYRIPLSLRGTTSDVDLRRLPKFEVQNPDLMRLELTYQTPEWEPGSTSFAAMEERLVGDPEVQLSTAERLSATSVHKLSVSANFIWEGPRGLSAEALVRNWSIPLERARRTLAATTQRGIRSRRIS